MTDYHHDHVVVYTQLGGNLRLASSLRATVTDSVTGLPVSVTQGSVTATYVDVDTTGRVAFTATTPNRLRLTSGATFVDVWPIEVSGPDDAGVATLFGTASATRAAADGRYAQGFADPAGDRILFWDDSAGVWAPLAPSTGLVITDADLTVRSASDTQTGIVELATSAETITGTDPSRAVTPAGLLAAAAATSAALTVGAGYTALDSGYAPAVAYKSPSGLVTVQGVIRRTGATITGGASGTIATLPAGYRPNGIMYCICAKEGTSVSIAVKTTGIIEAEISGTWTQNVSYVSIGFTFQAAA